MISAGDDVLLLAAGFVAAVVGTAGGITSLVSYPALLAVGIPPLPASVTNLVSFIGCWPGSAMASRPELRGRREWLVRWTLLTAAGGALGAALLLLTPPDAFGRVVPFLVAGGSVALLLQPRLSALKEHHSGGERALLAPGLMSLSVYNGYFGAGSGVMTLALLLFAVDDHLARANALKNMLIGAASVVGAVTFIAFGPVDWSAAVPMGIGMFAGSTVGPRVARRMPARLLRWLVALAGLGLAVKLWIAPT